ncbi:MAG: hypothetical protein NTZ44_02595 [Candidatus Nomurabacteria bacterium]|nr:hypothetical protein [Candidatus Nomurabacteria bacterium]
MKKTKFLLVLGTLVILSVLFANIAKAQTGYYIESTKFQKYAREHPNSMQYRYDKLNRMVLWMTPCNRDSINTTSYTYDAAGNRLSKTVLLFYKDKENNEKYICQTTMDPKQFSTFLETIFNQLDGKQ